jgi:outer membrane protein
MKRLPLFALFFTLATVVSAIGQTTAVPPAQKSGGGPAVGEAKVAVIAFQAAIGKTNEFQRDLADLQKKYGPRRDKLKTLNDDVDNLTKQLQDQGTQLSESERVSRARTLDEKKKELDRETQDAQGDFQNDLQQLISTIAEKVGTLMTDYATKHGYTLVLDAGDQQNAMVLYAVPSTDITQTIIDAYNQKSGIPAPPPDAPGAGAGAGQPAVDAPQPQPAPAH